MSRISILSLPVVLLAGCAPTESKRNANVDINAAAAEAQGAVDAYGANAADDEASIEVPETDAPANAAEPPDAARAPRDPPTPAPPGGMPDDRTPVSEAPSLPDGAQGAADVVQMYYALIGGGKYREAFALREPGATGPGTVSDFAAGFARYGEYHAKVGAPGEIDAGAGQRFVTVPVEVYARLGQGGTPVHEIGNVVLHRTGEIDGTTAEQRAWHIQSVTLKAAARR